MSHDITMATMVDCCRIGSQQTFMSRQETGNYYLLLTYSGVMNTMMGFEQQLEVRHRYLVTARIHAPTAVAQTLTSAGYQFKILYLILDSIMAVGHLLWDYIDYDTQGTVLCDILPH